MGKNEEYRKLIESPETRETLCTEQTILNVAELICELMETHGTSRSQLADKLGVTPGRITQILNGSANLTLATVAKVLAVFDVVLEVEASNVADIGKSPADASVLPSPCTSGWVNRTMDDMLEATSGGDEQNEQYRFAA